MKTLSLLVIAAALLHNTAGAQQTYATKEYIDINNIKAAHLLHGDMWFDPATQMPSCEYPKGSGKHVAGLGALWFGGYDAQNTLKVAAQTYRQTGNDYFPGPYDEGINTIAGANQHTGNWARIWKVNRTTIDSFRATTLHTVANTPAIIMDWPAKGNIYARGNQMAPLVVNQDMAPFVDLNGDGIYNPLNGDYPSIKGDQMLWSVFNDVMLPKGNTQSAPLGLEIRQSVYAYKRNSSLDNIVFYEYIIKNVGGSNLSLFQMGVNADFDLGYSMDDYIGFDSSHRMGYAYNSKNPDGNGEPTSYGTAIPMVGVSIMEFPNDRYPALLPVNSFTPYINDVSTIGNPTTAVEFFRLLNGKNRAGQRLADDRSAGGGSTGFGAGPATRYAFPGDPTNIAEWSQCQNRVPALDWRVVLSTDTMTFFTGTSKKIGIALIVSPDAGACGNLNMSGIRQLADTALITYYNAPAPLGIEVSRNSIAGLHIYPNPAHDVLYVVSPDDESATIKIRDISGREIMSRQVDRKGTSVIEMSHLSAGTYVISYKSSKNKVNRVFIKQ